MSLKFKSFFLGIILTSLTWIVILYLHSHLSKVSSFTNLTYRAKLKPRHDLNEDRRLALVNQPKHEYENEIDDKISYEDSDRLVELKYHVIPPDKTKLDLEDLGLVGSPDDQKVRDHGNRHHAFNLLVSNRLGLHRTFPDPRHKLCKSKKFDISSLPSASVIICFYNEALSTLIRTVISVIDRTPSQLLHEIILVDDSSDDTEMVKLLKAYVESHHMTKVKVLGTSDREGLIRARIFGARQATGQVLVFLDSHCEVSNVWMEPLLEEIASDYSRVVCPVIDIIDSDTFDYSPSPIVKGGFNWGLHFKWDSVPQDYLKKKSDFIKPIKSPTMAGGLFAINRKYFSYIGEYDEGMNIWGGENLELSFRIWMCGGSLAIIPCSHVGHVFRKRRPYGSPNGEDTMSHNSLRVAQVWMDDYKEYFYKVRSDLRDKTAGDISSRVALRKKLKCHSFKWYMQNVYPELKLPNDKPASSKKKKSKKQLLKEKIVNNSLGWRKRMPVIVNKYQIQLKGTGLCIQSEQNVSHKGSLFILTLCKKSNRQVWFETKKHELILAELLCMDIKESYPRLAKCHEQGGSQLWKLSKKDGKYKQLYNPAIGLCLGSKDGEEESFVTMEMCSKKQQTLWNLIPYDG